MEDIINIVTGLTVNERKKVFSWVASLPEENAIDIFQEGVKKSFQLKDQRPDLTGRINKYCAFVLAARCSGWDTIKGKGFRVADEKQFDDFSHLRKAKSAELQRRGRTPLVKRKVLAYWGEVVELHEAGCGFRHIARYMQEQHRIRVCATYLNTLWKEVKTL